MEPYFEFFLDDFPAKALPVAISFADEVLIFVFSNLGLTLPGLELVSPILLACTIAYWSYKLWHKSRVDTCKEAEL
jgi:hypothetical protein